MKRYVISSLFFIGMAAAVTNSADPFHDPNLEKIVRNNAIHPAPNTPLTQAQMDAVGIVSAQDAHVADLTGLERCANLETIYLKNTQVTDLTPIAKLDHLNALTIEGGKIRDLTPLAGLTNLEYLDLARNEISDLAPLAELKNLKELDLSDNKIADLRPLQNLAALRDLRLAGNQITDLDPLGKMQDLAVLDLRKNRVRDISVLGKLTAWRDFYLDQNQIANIAPLLAVPEKDAQLPKGYAPPRTLSLTGNPLSAAAVSRDLPELRKDLFDLTVDRSGTRLAPQCGFSLR
ncbi:MAG TPA: leucine-rich repeat domain-containing protein [Bryobacteraceae bacterium]|nr:leucine-rich repeat domain-containing protein [Bryobacteraceae bacterium]